MTRSILPEDRIHAPIQAFLENNQRDIVREVQAAIDQNEIVIVGMAQNPFPWRARRLLTKAGIAHRYLQYGSYLSQWRRRNALKMWTGWPTFPMVFVKGMLVGGAAELATLLANGELRRLLSTGR